MNHKHSLSSDSRSSSSSSINSDDGGSKEVRIAVVGQGGVGKSALIVRFITGRFLHSYNPTLEDKYTKTMRVEGESYRLSILDTAGEDDRHIMYYFSFSHVLLLLFDLNDRSSFRKARLIRQKADAHWHGSRPISTVLVGCKGDMERKVSTSEALAVAKELDCCYVETSAAEGHNCALPFKTAVKMYSHLYTDRSDIMDSGEHSNKSSRGIIRRLLSPMSSSGKRESRDLSPLRLPAARHSELSVVSPLRSSVSFNSHTPEGPEPITITISMES